MTATVTIAVGDPRDPDVTALLERHLALMRATSPPGHVHALDVDRLVDPSITFLAARRAGAVVGVGALKQLDASHAEIKSMHTAAEARGLGVARAILQQLLAVARERGCGRVSLETGTMDAFAPARSLYAATGFVPCEPFGEYTVNPYSTCMTLTLA